MQNHSEYSQHDRMMMIAAAIEQRHRMLELQQLREENECLHRQQQELFLQQQQQQQLLMQEGHPSHAYLHHRPAPLSERVVKPPQPQALYHHSSAVREGTSTVGQSDGLSPSSTTATTAAFHHQQPQSAGLAPMREAGNPIAPSSCTSRHNTEVTGAITAPVLSPASTGSLKQHTKMQSGASSMGVSARPTPPAAGKAPTLLSATTTTATTTTTTTTTTAASTTAAATGTEAPEAPVYGPTITPQHAQFVDMTTCTTAMIPFGLHDEDYLRRIGALAPTDDTETETGDDRADSAVPAGEPPGVYAAAGINSGSSNTAAAADRRCDETVFHYQQQQQQQQYLFPTPHVSQPGSPSAVVGGKTVVPTPRSQQQQYQHVDATPNHQISKSAAYQQQYAWTGCSVPSAGYSPAASSALGLTLSTRKQQRQQRAAMLDSSSGSAPRDESILSYSEDGVSHNLDDLLRAEHELATAATTAQASKSHQPTMLVTKRAVVKPSTQATPPQTQLGKAMQQLIHQIQQKKMGVRSEIGALAETQEEARNVDKEDGGHDDKERNTTSVEQTGSHTTTTAPATVAVGNSKKGGKKKGKTDTTNTSTAEKAENKSTDTSLMETPVGKHQRQTQQSTQQQPQSLTSPATGKTQHELRDTPPSTRRRPLSPNSRSLHVIKIVTPNGGSTATDAATGFSNSNAHSGAVSFATEARGGRHMAGFHDSAEDGQEMMCRLPSARRSLHDCLESTTVQSHNITNDNAAQGALDKKTVQQQQQQQQQRQLQLQKERGANIVEMLCRQHRDLVTNDRLTNSDTVAAAPATSTNVRGRAGSSTSNSGGNGNASRRQAPASANATAPVPSAATSLMKKECFDVLLAGHMNTKREAMSYTALEVGECVLFEGDRGVDMGRVIRCRLRVPDGVDKNNCLDGVEDAAEADGERETDADGSRAASNNNNNNSARNYKGSGSNGSGGGTAPLVFRVATPEEKDRWLHKQTAEAAETLSLCRESVAALKLPLEIVGAVFQFNREKLTFFYESSARVDFRQLLQNLFARFHCRIWMQRVDPTEEGETF